MTGCGRGQVAEGSRMETVAEERGTVQTSKGADGLASSLSTGNTLENKNKRLHVTPHVNPKGLHTFIFGKAGVYTC